MRSSIFNALLVWFFLGVIILAGSVPVLADQEKYIAYWKPGSGKSQILKFNGWEEFTNEWEELSKKNWRLEDLEVVKSGNRLKFISAWTPGTTAHALLAYEGFGNFAEAWQETVNDKNKQLLSVEVVEIDGKYHYIGIWGKGNGGSALFQLNTWEAFTDKWNELAKQNRVLIDVEAIPTPNGVRYLGVWEAGEGSKQALYNTKSFADFDKKWKELNKQDLRLTDIDRVPVGKEELFIGVWNKGTGGQYLSTFNTIGEVQNKNKEMNALKLDLVDFAAVDFGKPVPKPPAPTGKPLYKIVEFSKGQPMKKDPVSGLDFPADMPAIVYPEFDGCNAADRKVLEKAWAMAHHHAWRSVQVFQVLDGAGSYRDDLWKAGYTAGNDLELRKKSYSPYAFFGPYDGGTYRYDYIRDAVFMNWNKRFKEKMTFKCRRKDSGGAHPCYLNNPGGNGTPSANHIVNGTVNYCNDFFDASNDRGRVKTVLHENFHWLAPKGLAILDTHTHWDRNSKGFCRADTSKFYGIDDVMHLATSKGCWNDPHFHQGDAARNNDTYAYFMLNLGEAVYSGKLKQFPAK